MHRSGVINKKIDYKKTDEKVRNLLKDVLIPLHYNSVFHQAICYSANGTYSHSTDPIEKFRQRFAEHKHQSICHIKGGYLALKEWFPERNGQMKMFPPKPHSRTIKGKCLLSYEAGFEQAKRQQHMKDHFNDADTVSRHERRRRAALVESHIKDWFKLEYPEFYLPPSNEGKYSQPSKDDFRLRFPGYNGKKYNAVIDVKTWSDNAASAIGVIRRIHDDIIYLWADWYDDDTIKIYGIEWGKWLRSNEKTATGLTVVRDIDLISLDILLVGLNMSRAGMDYMEFKDNVTQ